MGGNLEITTSIGTITDFQEKLMAPKIPDIVSSLEKTATEELMSIEDQIVNMINGQIVGWLGG